MFEVIRLSSEYIYSQVARKSEPTWQVDTGGYLSAYVTIPEGAFNIRKHILVFFVSNGFIPEHVDHRDNNKLNNAPNNLRAASKCQNHHNSKVPKNNTSGVKGVSQTRNGKWEVSIKAFKIKHYGGSYNSLEEAKCAANKLREKLHGDFARSK